MKRKILSYSTFLAETKSHPILNEGVDYSAVSSSELQSIIDIDMRKYLKTAMWNKSIEVFYGKDYKGNPAEDKGELYVGDWSYEGHDKTTMGEFFMDAWAETDQFCDRVVELVEKGEISDMWNTIGRGAKWAAIGVAIAGAVVATGGMALGALGVVGAVSASSTLQVGSSATIGNGLTVTAGTFTADMTKIVCTDSGLPAEYATKLIGHLAADDFFNVEKFPTAKFVISEVKAEANGENTHVISGNLT